MPDARPAPPGYRRLTINFPDDLIRRLKVYAAETDQTMTEVVERAIAERLEAERGEVAT